LLRAKNLQCINHARFFSKVESCDLAIGDFSQQQKAAYSNFQPGIALSKFSLPLPQNNRALLAKKK